MAPAERCLERMRSRCCSGTDWRLWLKVALVSGLLLVSSAAQAQLSVRVAPLQEVLVDSLRRAPAEVLPLNDSLIAAEVNAVVAAVHADVGQVVAQGEPLVTLDERDFRLQLEAAAAGLAAARAQHADAVVKLERARQLSDDQYLSADELLNRETALALASAEIARAQAQEAIARRNLEKARILAPFDGVIQERPAQVGAYVTVGMPLLRLTQTDALELAAELPSAVAPTLLDAEAIWFESQGEQWALRLLRLSPVVDPGRRSQQARFAFVGDAPAAGRSGQLVWREQGGQLPASLLSRRDGALGVFLFEDGVAVFHPLPDAEEGRAASTRLPVDAEIIVQGQDRLQDGDPVVRP